MFIKNLHSWDIAPKEAIEIQGELCQKIIRSNKFKKIKTIAGADIALKDNTAVAGIIVYSYPDLDEIERCSAKGNINFPYIPGLLTFREGPILIEAFKKIKIEPDLIIFDGQGIMHPRGIGLASHMGLILNKPTVGCAKSHLFGKYKMPAPKKGDFSLILNDKDIIGACLRTRDNVRPVFISIGHKINLLTAIKIIMNCVDGFRIPKPTRDADRFAKSGLYGGWGQA